MADLDSRSTGNLKQNAQNAEQTKVVRNSNYFPLDYKHPTSHRYADIDIFYHYYGERGDIVPLRTGHSVRTFTFASPNEIDIFMRKEFLHIPMQAIYPRTWNEVLYPLPVDGDIAPPDGRANFPLFKYFRSLHSRFTALVADGSWNDLPIALKLLDCMQNIISNGSLFAKVNMHFADFVRYGTYKDSGRQSFDRIVSTFYADLFSALKGTSISFYSEDSSGTEVQYVIYVGDPADNTFVDRPTVDTWHRLHDYFREYNYNFRLGSTPATAFTLPSFTPVVTIPVDTKINIEPLLAYQLCCAQFYTNDRVDNIFSANTYRNYIQQLQMDVISLDSFEFNGVTYLYDIFSEHNFNKLVDLVSSAEPASLSNVLDPINQMFEYRKSLRFGDYFLGARLKPLAVGESSIPVVGDSVQVEDITKSAALQRLRYNINVLGRKIANQLMGLIPGNRPTTPQDIPTSIASQEFNIGKDQTETTNTGEAQLSDSPRDAMPVTSVLNSGASDFAFKIELSEPCIILGLVSFSVPRIYSKTIDRFAFHYDRYDMLIPQMQFVGDQEIYRKELFGLAIPGANLPFAYNQRYSEYKQRYSFASGAFIEFLPSWEMITDNQDGTFLQANKNLDSTYSHSVSSEFDRFYKSLSGNSLADYFHFIVTHYNTSTPDRAMAWNPQPLL